jgi:hypothetical protein
MHPSLRPLSLLLVASAAIATAAIASCSSPDLGLRPKLSAVGGKPMMQKVQATDSVMNLTNTSYSDTAAVLKRTTALPADISVTALIGSAGGTLEIPSAGIRVEIPGKALSAPTQLTMTALKGDNVAYEFGPHGTLFNKPLKVTQDLTSTVAAAVAKQVGIHGAYFPTSLDSAWVDAGKGHARIKENQLSYKVSDTQLKFYVDHFSGYMVALGAW